MKNVMLISKTVNPAVAKVAAILAAIAENKVARIIFGIFYVLGYVALVAVPVLIWFAAVVALGFGINTWEFYGDHSFGVALQIFISGLIVLGGAIAFAISLE